MARTKVSAVSQQLSIHNVYFLNVKRYFLSLEALECNQDTFMGYFKLDASALPLAGLFYGQNIFFSKYIMDKFFLGIFLKRFH